MTRNKLVRFGGIALAAAVLVTGSWYTSQETGTATVPQLVEYVDTEDGSIVIPEEEVPLASKPTVNVKKTTKRTTKKSTMKTKAKKTAKTTSRSTKSQTVKKETSQQKISTDTTILTTVVSATKKNSKIKTVTTTVETTVKTTTTNKPKTTATAAKTTTTTAAKATTSTASGNTAQTVTNVNVRTIAPKANANVLKAFESMEFKIEVNPTVSYSGYFNAANHKITLKKNSSDTIYHELGHFVGWLAGNVDTSSAFVKIYNEEKGALKSANYQYVTQNSSEYFAESYKEFVLSPSTLKATRPQTYEYVANAVARITDARTATIKAAYMKAYWS